MLITKTISISGYSYLSISADCTWHGNVTFYYFFLSQIDFRRKFPPRQGFFYLEVTYSVSVNIYNVIGDLITSRASEQPK